MGHKQKTASRREALRNMDERLRLLRESHDKLALAGRMMNDRQLRHKGELDAVVEEFEAACETIEAHSEALRETIEYLTLPWWERVFRKFSPSLQFLEVDEPEEQEGPAEVLNMEGEPVDVAALGEMPPLKATKKAAMTILEEVEDDGNAVEG